jgi:hypothetical protein
MKASFGLFCLSGFGLRISNFLRLSGFGFQPLSLPVNDSETKQAIVTSLAGFAAKPLAASAPAPATTFLLQSAAVRRKQ